jgi:hypothetical protein
MLVDTSIWRRYFSGSTTQAAPLGFFRVSVVPSQIPTAANTAATRPP